MSVCDNYLHVFGSYRRDGEVWPEKSCLFKIFHSHGLGTRLWIPRTNWLLLLFNFAEIAAPLTDLIHKDAPNRVVWTPTCDRSLSTLKQPLCSSPILRIPDFKRPFILQTDPSDHGVGAVLSQQDDNGLDHPFPSFSHKLLPCELKYSTVEKECLACSYCSIPYLFAR